MIEVAKIIFHYVKKLHSLVELLCFVRLVTFCFIDSWFLMLKGNFQNSIFCIGFQNFLNFLLFIICPDDWVKLKCLCKNLSFESHFSPLSIMVYLSNISWLLLLIWLECFIYLCVNLHKTVVFCSPWLSFLFNHYYLKF